MAKAALIGMVALLGAIVLYPEIGLFWIVLAAFFLAIIFTS